MKKSIKSLAALLLAGLVLGFAGCKTESEDSSDSTPPAKVTLAENAVMAANSKAVLTWANPADSDFYATRVTVLPALENGNSTLVVEGKASEKSTVTFEGLANGTEYTFTLYAMDKSLNVSDGVPVKATPRYVPDESAPAAVTNLSVSCINGSNGKVNAVLTWTDPSDDDLFGMEVTYAQKTSSRAAVETMSKESIFVAPQNNGVVITDLTAGKTYTFTVIAMDTSGNKSNGATKDATMSFNQLSELKITLTPSTTEITNQDVTVSVSATSSSSVSKIYYVSGIKQTVADVLKGTDITSTAAFAVPSNGTYTVAAVDYDGRRELSYITVSNINKTIPKAPINLAASYNYTKKIITITWNTSDSDIDYYLVSYKKDGAAVVTDEKLTEKTYTVNNVEVETTDVSYEFSVKAVDVADNTGSSATAVITPKDAPLVSMIELSKKSFSYKESGTEFTATVYGSNFDLIEKQDDKTIYVQIVDSSNNATSSPATIDVTNNKATAILTLPALSSATTEGTDFTIRAKVCDEVDEEHTTTFNISDVAKVINLTLETTQISINNVISGNTTKATVEGSNFDVAGTITLALYDSTDKQYGSSINVDSSSFTQSTTTFDVNIPLPTLDDTYSVKVLFADVAQSKTASLQVYGAPAFTSFKIPNAGITKQDNFVTATVIGKNFKAPEVREAGFSVSCTVKNSIVKNSTITILNDSRLKVTLKIPGTAGGYEVTIASGSNSASGTFTVKDYSFYEVGDVILKNGSKVGVANVSSATFDTTGDTAPVAVVAGLNANGAVLGLGLKTEDENLAWASYDNKIGYYATFTDIIVEYSGDSSNGYTFTGDLDGSDNWDAICLVDPEGTIDAETNYPLFYFANTYGTNLGNSENFATGWYIPSIAELYEVYKNKDTIQKSLEKIGGFYFWKYEFWSSSQSTCEEAYKACCMYFGDGTVSDYSKGISSFHGIVVRAL